jgi:hypothetical protein
MESEMLEEKEKRGCDTMRWGDGAMGHKANESKQARQGRTFITLREATLRPHGNL